MADANRVQMPDFVTAQCGKSAFLFILYVSCGGRFTGKNTGKEASDRGFLIERFT
jgi:hypothetical protein